jgi:hypothetical protein
MGGGSIWYAPDATVPKPEFRLVYRVGPGASAAVFTITPDDRYLLQPIQGTWAPGDPLRNRDYPGQSARRVIALDIQKLLAAGNDVQCAAPPVQTDADGIIQRITARNNGAADCPIATGERWLNSKANFESRGGPHFMAFNHETRRVAVANYFVQLTPFNLPGTHMAGDDRVCMLRLTHTGELVRDSAFKDELTGRPCISMDRPKSYLWPNHGRTGAAKPHAVAFIDVGSGED